MADVESEQSGLMGGGNGGNGKEKKIPDWSRFGLSSDQQKESEQAKFAEHGEERFRDYHANTNELFHEDQSAQSKPWWKANFFVIERVLFGTWDGVFTSCMINIFGVVIFLRTGWMVGNAGIGLSILIIVLTISVALIGVLSGIGVCERCKMESGGVYFLLSHILGARIGASVGILYCFGQAVACSLYVMGFGESIASLLHQDNEWVARGIAVGILVLLLGINVAGVKWVIRLQLLLLIVLSVAVLDFLVGSFVHTDKVNAENGFLGYSVANLVNNSAPVYQSGESFFTVFGVFFPTATGVFAGINMSGDLRHPSRDIPVGTLSAVGVSTFLYVSFVLVLGATCAREALQLDYMIAEKVAVVGVLFLAGLYISSISSCMGGLYGSPRILQSIANENVIPFIKVLGQGKGPNKVPVFALIVITFIALIFIFIGNVNTLGPIVTMPFMLSYAAVDYCYFSLAMSFDKRKAREDKFRNSKKMDSPDSIQNGGHGLGYGSLDGGSRGDLDNLFPERTQHDKQGRLKRQGSLKSPVSPVSSNGDVSKPYDKSPDAASMVSSEADDTSKLLDSSKAPPKPTNTEILKQPRSCYSIFCNRWLSVFGVFACFLIMFAIQWLYALVCFLMLGIIYFYIGHASPGVFPGIAEFSLWEWIRDGFKNCCRRGPPQPEQIVVSQNTPSMNTMAAQLTEDNEDFAGRGRYHQSEVVQGENFDDYQSD